MVHKTFPGLKARKLSSFDVHGMSWTIFVLSQSAYVDLLIGGGAIPENIYNVVVQPVYFLDIRL